MTKVEILNIRKRILLDSIFNDARKIVHKGRYMESLKDNPESIVTDYKYTGTYMSPDRIQHYQKITLYSGDFSHTYSYIIGRRSSVLSK